MKFSRHCKPFRGRIDAAPWACLFFVMLIFFLLKTSLFFVPGVRIDLPQARGLSGVTNATVAVMIDRDGRMFYNHQVVDSNMLRQRLSEAVKASKSSITLIVQADRRLDLQRLVELEQIAGSSGVKDLLLGSRPLMGEELKSGFKAPSP